MKELARLFFFGSLGELLGRVNEIALPEEEMSVRDLISFLRKSDSVFDDALGGATYKVALNNKIVDLAANVQAGDELSFLPPFSGG